MTGQAHLSDVFKFTQGLGQKGHQIGRKVGDAIELLTLAMIYRDEALSKFLVIENGIEGATTAKHKVEFAFYNLKDDVIQKTPENLFGIIECKKVGVEQTIKQNFKTWSKRLENKRAFYQTEGYSFIISPSNTAFKWLVNIKPADIDNTNIVVCVNKITNKGEIKDEYSFNCIQGDQLLVAQDIHDDLFVLGPNESLSGITASIKKCVIIQITSISENKVGSILVNESLPGPQTPEKAKQASFVSLDVRKRVLGRFDKTNDDTFKSILVIGEASHWEEKSRSMIRLCNDYNLIIPDDILVKLFQNFEQEFGDNYQGLITKTNYRNSERVRYLLDTVIEHFNGKILFEMGTEQFVEFEYFLEKGKNKIRIKPLN